MTKIGNREARTVYSWNEFVSRRLTVAPDVLGRKHRFRFEGTDVVLSLPTVARVTRKDLDEHAVASIGTRRADNNAALDYSVHRVNVEIYAGKKMRIDPATLQRNPNAFDLYSSLEHRLFDELCDKHRECAKRAFEYWLLIVRWQMNDARIGRPVIVGNESGWTTWLRDTVSDHRLWIEGMGMTIRAKRVVEKSKWLSIGRILKRGLSPPLHIVLRQDAEISIENGDCRKALTELAMSCEVFLRAAVISRLPKNTMPSVVEAIEESNISQYVNKHFRGLLRSNDLPKFRKLSGDLTSLFAKRNKLLHMGDTTDVTTVNCQRFFKPLLKSEWVDSGSRS